MLSMTGYGRGEYTEGGLDIAVEVKSVNNRYLDVSIKCPRMLSFYEDSIRSAVRDELSRGHADVYITVSDRRAAAGTVTVNEAAAASYAAAAGRLAEMFPSLKDDFSVSALMRCPDVVAADDMRTADDETVNGLNIALKKALASFRTMRQAEGERLGRDMLSKLDVIEGLVDRIAARAPEISREYAEKLRERMREYLADAETDEARILSEAALFADRSCIDEEITRLRSHIAQFREICAGVTVGKKLDFLVQEFNRETNTICSKSSDLEITGCGLDLKNEIEKIREQVQNIE